MCRRIAKARHHDRVVQTGVVVLLVSGWLVRPWMNGVEVLCFEGCRTLCILETIRTNTLWRVLRPREVEMRGFVGLHGTREGRGKWRKTAERQLNHRPNPRSSAGNETPEAHFLRCGSHLTMMGRLR